jgi:nucleoside-diphosphate kinase
MGRNIIHGSDSPKSAQEEISMWFKPEEVSSWTLSCDKWLYEGRD